MQQNHQQTSETPSSTRKIPFDTIESLKRQLAEHPGMALEPLSAQYGLPVAQLIELLPPGTWKRTDGSHFADIMKTLSKLGKMTLIINTGDVILEYSGEVPNGGVAHGYYNLSPKSPLRGHLKHESCKAIYLVERPFMNTRTVSIQFANGEGKIMFKVYAGRDEERHLLPHQVEAMQKIFKTDSPGAAA